jgi:Sugar phosphate isomerases/epimerases
MVATNPDGTGCENIPILARLGFDYAELPVSEITSLSRSETEAIVLSLRKHDLRCDVCNNLFPARIKLTGPEMDIESIKEHAKSALYAAGKLGAKTVVFGSGVARDVPHGFSMFEAFGQLVYILEVITPIAVSNEITLVLEPARSPDTNIIHSYNAAYNWKNASGMENVQLMFDYFHMASECEPLYSILDYPGELGHIHIACPVNNLGQERQPPVQNDGWDYADFFDTLKLSGYDKSISIEAFAGDFETQARQSISFLKGALVAS